MVEQRSSPASAFSEDEARISIRRVQDKPGIAAAVFGPLADADVTLT